MSGWVWSIEVNDPQDSWRETRRWPSVSSLLTAMPSGAAAGMPCLFDDATISLVCLALRVRTNNTIPKRPYGPTHAIRPPVQSIRRHPCVLRGSITHSLACGSSSSRWPCCPSLARQTSRYDRPSANRPWSVLLVVRCCSCVRQGGETAAGARFGDDGRGRICRVPVVSRQSGSVRWE